MSSFSRFLSDGESVSVSDLQGGEIDIRGLTLSAANFAPNLPVKTDEDGVLFSTKLEKSDIIGLDDNNNDFDARITQNEENIDDLQTEQVSQNIQIEENRQNIISNKGFIDDNETGISNLSNRVFQVEDKTTAIEYDENTQTTKINNAVELNDALILKTSFGDQSARVVPSNTDELTLQTDNLKITGNVSLGDGLLFENQASINANTPIAINRFTADEYSLPNSSAGVLDGSILKFNQTTKALEFKEEQETKLNNINVDVEGRTDVDGRFQVAEEQFRDNEEVLFQSGGTLSKTFLTNFDVVQRGVHSFKYENLNLSQNQDEVLSVIVFEGEGNINFQRSYSLIIRNDSQAGYVFSIVDENVPVQQVVVQNDINLSAGEIELRKEAVDVLTIRLDGRVVMTQRLNVSFLPGPNFTSTLQLFNPTTSSVTVTEVRGFTPRLEVENDDLTINGNVQLTGNRELLLGGNSGQSEDQACVVITLIAGETIRQGRVLKVVNVGGQARVQTVKGGDPDSTIVIGIAAETRAVGQPVKVCIGGVATCTVQTNATINPGNFLEKSDSLIEAEQGRVTTFGPGGSIAGMFAVSISPSTTGNLAGTEQVKALFIRNELA